MAQVKTSKPLTYYIDTPSVRVFQTFAGETLEKLDELEAWDVVTILCQAASLANQYDQIAIDIPEAIEALAHDVALSEISQTCLNALNGFPVVQVNLLMIGILGVAFEGDMK